MEITDVYLDWAQSATDAEKLLFDKVYDFGEFFKDMLFEKDTVPYNLIKCQVRVSDADAEREKWIDDDFLRPDELAYFSYTYFKIRVEKLPSGYAGCYNEHEQLLCVTPEAATDDATVLHEMIHLHEGVINGLPFFS